jgi:uncharacterized protein YndB with AHSA1/START domain
VRPLKLTFRRTFPGPPDKVFQAFLSGEALKAWWSPEGYTAIEAQADARPGGQYRLVMRSQTGTETVYVRGVYREVDPPHRLVFTHTFESRGSSAAFAVAGLVGHETLVTVELTAQGDMTELMLTQEQIPTSGAEDMLRVGWEGILDKLARRFS